MGEALARHYGTAIIGVGGVGSAAAYRATLENDGSVIGVEQYELGHLNGGSEGDSRIARYEQHDPVYAELVRYGIAAWKAVGQEAEQELFIPTGSLNLDTDRAYLNLLESSLNTVQRPGDPKPYEQLDPYQIMDRWPQFVVPDNMYGLYHEDSGLVDATKANAAHVALARNNGATLLENSPVKSIEIIDGLARITMMADGRSFEADRLIITAGGWTNRLLASLGIKLPIIVTQEQVMYYKPTLPATFAIGRFPIWLSHQEHPDSEKDDEHYYGFPLYGKRQATKASIDLGGLPLVEPGLRTFEPDERITESTRTAMKPIIPGYGWERSPEVVTCQYDMAPDRDFILDTLPGHGNVALAVVAGHGFKHLAELGRTLNQLVRGQQPPFAIDRFRLDRPALTDPSFPVDLWFGATGGSKEIASKIKPQD